MCSRCWLDGDGVHCCFDVMEVGDVVMILVLCCVFGEADNGDDLQLRDKGDMTIYDPLVRDIPWVKSVRDEF